jgi:RND family efflux transporter MFP subunit
VKPNLSIEALAHVLRVLLCSAPLVLVPPAQAEDKPAAPAKAVLTVVVTVPTEVQWSTSIAASGNLQAWQEAVVAAELGGQRIAQLRVDVGDTVQRGQELALLGQEAVQADVAQAEARVAQAEASLDEARGNAVRARSMKTSGAMPVQQIDQMLISETTAKANLSALQATLNAQRIRLQQTRIVAVDDGVISARSATLGMVVQPGAELFRLVRQNKVEWYAEITGRDLAQVKPGQTVRLTLPTGESVAGTVRIVAPTLDPNTRTALAYVSLAPHPSARPGMYAEGEILVGTTAALTLPQSAVILRDGNSYAFSVDSEQRIRQNLVKTGRRMAGRVEILSGLDAQASVVATGGAFLNDGDRVQIVAPVPSAVTP